MFWFTVALMLLLVWLSERSQLKNKAKDMYKSGWRDGYTESRNRVAKLLHQEKIHSEGLDKYFNATVNTPNQLDDTVGLSVNYTQISDELTEVEENGDINQGLYQEEPDAPQYQELQPEESAADKEQRTLKNLNTLLYVGSFMIVAAAALFVNLVMPAVVKLSAIILVTFSFYATGLILHAKSERLRPAAIAFVGTGLAILPFVGLALTSLGGLSGSTAWLITSVVGLVLYGVAAVRLQSQLVSYLTIAFVLSLAMSAVSTLSLAIVWYFIVVIGVSVICNSIHFLRPSLLPKIFWQPVEQTGILTTPVALLASLVMGSQMDIFMYEVLFGVATAHYLVVWLEKRSVVYELIIRTLAHITLLIMAFDFVGGYNTPQQQVAINIAWVSLASLQIIYSLLRASSQPQKNIERLGVVIGMGLIAWNMPMWLTVENSSRGVALDLTLIGLAALGATLRLRQIEWAYVGLAVSAILPVVVSQFVVDPAVPFEVIAIVYAALGALSLVGLERALAASRSQLTQFASIATGLYVVCVLLSGLSSGSSAVIGWTTLLACAGLVALSYLLRVVAIEVTGAALVLASVTAWAYWLEIDSNWTLTLVVSTFVALTLAAAFAHHTFREYDRRDGLVLLAGTVLAGLIFTYGSALEVLRVATVLLLTAGIAMFALRIVTRNKQGTLSLAGLCFGFVYPVLALMIAVQAGAGWLALASFVLMGMLWLASYIERTPMVLAFGNILLLAALNALWSWLAFDEAWRLPGVSWLAAAIYYLLYWYSRDRNDKLRQQISLISTLLILGVVTCLYFFNSSTQWVMAAAGSLLMGSAVLAIHGYLEKKDDYVEVAVYAATIGLQRIVSAMLPEANFLMYCHWWAITVALMAIWRKDYHSRLVVTLAFVTGSTGIYAMAVDDTYSILFLIEHLIILVTGALVRKQWVMWWGIISVIFAILYFLRNFTAMALLFLGFLLILFVVWRLLKVGKKQE